MRGLLVAVVGILVLTFGLAYAMKRLFQIEPGRREAAITGTSPACQQGPGAGPNAAPPVECNDKAR